MFPPRIKAGPELLKGICRQCNKDVTELYILVYMCCPSI
uniref:Uncharacterized protein n=1 Tax=Anguilla anguilla TaxID=7936 RepID=A0A0E9W6M3_ANGAN